MEFNSAYIVINFMCPSLKVWISEASFPGPKALETTKAALSPQGRGLCAASLLKPHPTRHTGAETNHNFVSLSDCPSAQRFRTKEDVANPHP